MWNCRCINAGKSIRNEDQAAMHKGLLRAIITPEVVASRVADMMPTVPGYPRQIPINATKVTPASNPFDDSNRPAAGSAPGSGEPVVNGNHSDKSSKVGLNGVHNGGDAKAEQTKPDVAASNTDATASGVDIPAGASAELLSPTSPLPLEELKISADDLAIKAIHDQPAHAMKKAVAVEESLPYVYFGTFDGHAGSGVAVAAANTLHKIIQEKFQNIADLLIEFGLKNHDRNTSTSSEYAVDNHEFLESIDGTYIDRNQTTLNGSTIINHDKHIPENNVSHLLFQPATDKIVTVDSLIIGALESAFWEMVISLLNCSDI